MWIKGIKEQALANVNPTWSKGDRVKTLKWMGWCFGHVKVIFPPIPNILCSDSKFTRQNAGMVLILCPSGRTCPQYRHKYLGLWTSMSSSKTKKIGFLVYIEISCEFHLGGLGLESLVLSGNTDKTSLLHQNTDYNLRIPPKHYLKPQPASSFSRSILSYQQSWPFALCICCPVLLFSAVTTPTFQVKHKLVL